jgi:Co/Zn/Cd efflux system component
LERDEFYKFWGHKNEKKFDVLNSILRTVTILRKRYPTSKDDFDLMTNWAKNVDLKNYESDIIGQIKNVAVATV